MNITSRLPGWIERIARVVALLLSEHARAQYAAHAAAMPRRCSAALRDLYFEHRAELEASGSHAKSAAIPPFRLRNPSPRSTGSATVTLTSKGPRFTERQPALSLVADDERR